MFRAGFPSIISSSKLHIQSQVFVRPLLLPAASLARLTAGSSNCDTLHLVGYKLRGCIELHRFPQLH